MQNLPLWLRLSVAVGFVILISTTVPMVGFVGLVEIGVVDPTFLFQRADGSRFEDDDDESIILRVAMLTGGLSLVFGIITAVIASREFSRPITQLAKASERIGTGDLDYRVTIPQTSRELQQFVDAFNQMAADLQEAEELRRRLMADVSHELRTPLTVLEGNLRAALDKVYDLDEAEIANLYSQTHHLSRLVEDLHLLARAEAKQLPLNRELVDIKHVVREVKDNFSTIGRRESNPVFITHCSGSPHDTS